MSPPELLHCQGGVYLFRYIANRSQHPQYIKKAIVVVLALDWAASVSFWQFLEHLGEMSSELKSGAVASVTGVWRAIASLSSLAAAASVFWVWEDVIARAIEPLK